MRLLTQNEYWSREAQNFDAIYSHKKSKLAVFMDKLLRRAMFDRFSFTLEQSESITGKTFLDVGCGTGLYCLELARRGAKKVVGIDVSEMMIEICRKRAKDEGLVYSTEFVTCDIIKFSSNHRFNITIGMGLLDYIKKPAKTLKRIRELTDGKVMLSFPILMSWRTLPRIIRLRLKRCPVFFYTSRQVQRLLTEAGFTKIRIRPMGPMYFVIAS